MTESISEILIWIGLGLTVLFGLTAALFTVKGFGLVRIGWLNFARLKDLENRVRESNDPLEKQALETVVRNCHALREKWILRESDLRVGGNTQRLIEEIASVYHSSSSEPLSEARVGRLLNSFLELKDRILVLSEMKGIRKLTQFRLRHLRMLSHAWGKKEEWERSSLGRAMSKYKVMVLLKWSYYLVRFLDISFWTFKMLGYIFHDIVFKILLLRWYLTVGELAMQIYADPKGESDGPPADLLGGLKAVPEQVLPTELQGEVRKIADDSRKTILFDVGILKLDEVKKIYFSLVENIARHHYPQSAEPLYEAKLFDLMIGVARFAEMAAGIRETPVLNRLLHLRVSHVLLVKDTADFLRDSEILNWIQKYHLSRLVKFSSIIFKVVRKKHPGLLLQEFTFALAKEGGKRWVYVYLHDKIAVEANHVYKETDN